MYYKGLNVKKEYTTTEGKTLYRLSNWTRIQEAYNVTSRNEQLGYYRTDENGYREGQANFDPTNGTFCRFFRFHGRKYAIDRFLLMCSPFGCAGSMAWNEKDGLHNIAAYDAENYFNPLLIEISDCGEYVRVFLEA